MSQGKGPLNAKYPKKVQLKIQKNFRAKLIWKNDEKIMKLPKDHVKNVESKNFILNNE